ncbi:MAG: MFS transporter, partial [Candidatus Sumerlaeia bacterium]|nr:MFS transporter [Candidatus Sumerlaeia bacterium]
MASNKTKEKIFVFGLASFLNDLGSDMIFPVWPLFVTVYLGANMAVLGFIDGLGDAIVSVSQALSGYYSDRWQKRKIFIWTGYLMGAIARIGYALATAWQQLIPFKLLDRGGKVRGAPRDAFVSDLSSDQNRATHFGFLRMMDNLGAFSGIVLCILLLKPLGFRNLFLLAAIPSVISAVLILIAIHERKLPTVKLYKGINLNLLTRDFRIFLMLSVLFSLGFFSYSFLLVFAKNLGFQMTFIPVFYLIFTTVAAIFSLPFGKLADGIGRKPVILLAFTCWIGVCLSAIFASSSKMAFLMFFLYGLHRGAMEPVQKSFIAELSPPQFKASGLGGYQMVTGLCAFPASFLA